MLRGHLAGVPITLLRLEHSFGDFENVYRSVFEIRTDKKMQVYVEKEKQLARNVNEITVLNGKRKQPPDSATIRHHSGRGI